MVVLCGWPRPGFSSRDRHAWLASDRELLKMGIGLVIGSVYLSVCLPVCLDRHVSQGGPILTISWNLDRRIVNSNFLPQIPDV